VFPALEATWTGAVGEHSTWGQCYLDGYLYVALWIDPGKVIKIDPSTMTTVDSWTGAANQVGARPLETDGTYLYVGVASGPMWDAPSRIVKINPATMTTVAEWVGTCIMPTQCNPERIIYDAPNIYVAININGGLARVVKINPATMTTVDEWNSVIATRAKGLTLFDDYFYVPDGSGPAIIEKVNKNTMAYVSHWTGDMADGGSIEGLVWGVTNDGTHLYAATYDTGESNPLRLIKIDVSTMTTVDKYQGDADEWLAYSCIYDSVNNHIYIGTYGWPKDIIVRVDPTTMTKVDRWEGAGNSHNMWDFSISNPEYLFASIWITPGSALKFELPVPAKGGSSPLLLFAKMLMG